MTALPPLDASRWTHRAGHFGLDASNIGEALDAIAVYLAAGGAPPSRQEARDLVAAVLDVPRFWPSAHRDRALTPPESAAMERAAARLAAGMPFAYAVGSAAFRRLTLEIDERVLIPRPETEVLVDLVLDSSDRGSGTVIDVGTGSGCIALSLAGEGTFDRVIATDLSSAALDVARANAGRLLGANAGRIEFRQGEFLAPCAAERATVVVSNPPYISPSEAGELPALVRDWEPGLALFADDDGMAAIARIAQEATTVLVSGGLLALEVDSRRAERAAQCVAATGAYRDIAVQPDLTGRARFVLARRVEE